MFLKDKTPVPTKIEGTMPPPDFPHYRVCDYAFASLYPLRTKLPKHLSHVRKSIIESEPYEERDKRIALFVGWWKSSDSDEIRKGMRSLLADEELDPEMKKKIREEMKKLRIKIEKGQKPKPPKKNPEEDERLETPDAKHEK
jgi:hypothetical protein